MYTNQVGVTFLLLYYKLGIGNSKALYVRDISKAMCELSNSVPQIPPFNSVPLLSNFILFSCARDQIKDLMHSGQLALPTRLYVILLSIFKQQLW